MPAQPMHALIPELEALIQGEVQVEKLMVNPKKVDCSGFTDTLRRRLPRGVTDPKAQLNKIVKRAVEMMDVTIGELKRMRSEVKAWPKDKIIASIGSNAFADSLAKRMNIDVFNRASWDGEGPGKVGLVIRWLYNIRNLLASGDLRYTCVNHDKLCDWPSWAWTIRPIPAAIKAKVDLFHIRLCERFWIPGTDDQNNPIPDDRHFELQVQTLIHETSHIYYASIDRIAVGPWVAECVSQFIAETNGVRIDPDFEDRCQKL